MFAIRHHAPSACMTVLHAYRGPAVAYVAWPPDPNRRVAPLPLAGAAAGCPCSSNRDWHGEVRNCLPLSTVTDIRTEANWAGRHGC